mmetsp:Transcript_8235/g.15641  ORF Transcript_8235/g.15641 Transcript_8235/m.15641 type:complete len:661 (-) Transcript_8235:441-2423(-)
MHACTYGTRAFATMMLVLLPLAAETRSLALHAISLRSLQEPSGAVYDGVRNTMEEIGMFAVTLDRPDDLDDGGSQPKRALREFVRCMQGNAADELQSTGAVRTVHLDDGSQRASLSTVTNHSVPELLAPSVVRECPGFVAASAELRSTVDSAGRAFGLLLDHLTDGPGEAHTSNEHLDHSFHWAASNAESLEHFHLFTKPETNLSHAASAGEPALHMHSDMGIFLIMTPAAYFRIDEAAIPSAPTAGMNSGFYLELPSGELVHPTFPPNSLLVMGGEASARWMQRPRPPPVYAPAHEVVLPEMHGLGRAWYGRMYFPPREARLTKAARADLTAQEGALHASVNMSFGEMREQTYDAYFTGRPEAALALGCHASRRQLQDEQSCSDGMVWCWMQCQKLPGNNSCTAEESLCQAPDGKLWPEDFTSPDGEVNHCLECAPVCPDKDIPEPETDEICNTYFQATVMWMSGFQVLDEHNNRPCVALLFEGWELDTEMKFVIGCIGTFFMGVFVEFLVFTRRQVKQRMGVGQNLLEYQLRIVSGGMLLLYLVQVSIGYMLMLVAMTYQVELFLMVVFGLTAGHGVFNMGGPVLESAEACCQGLDPNENPTRIFISSSDKHDVLDSAEGPGSNGVAANMMGYNPPNCCHVEPAKTPSCCATRDAPGP